jgi:menaquinone-dependent protoporphyrinogen oxidase
MKAAVLYATREGQTKRIADRIASDLRTAGFEVDVYNVKALRAIDWPTYSVACLAASVHAGHHEKEMIAFAKRHRADLQRLGAAFVSVTLSEAGAEDRETMPQVRSVCAADAQHMVDVFVHDTGWRPAHVLKAAGALAYSQYNFLVKFLLKRIARHNGFSGDTSRDYEFTDWTKVDRFASEISGAAGSH